MAEDVTGIPVAKAEELEDARPLKLTKRKTAASGKVRSKAKGAMGVPAAKEMAKALVDIGVIDHDKPLLSRVPEFMTLESMGTPPDVMREVMGLTQSQYNKLRQFSIDHQVSMLQETGALGTIAQAMTRLEHASQKALAHLSTIKVSDKAVLDAVRMLSDIESRKVDILVRTGAVKVEKKIVIQQEMTANTRRDFHVLSGRAALRILQELELQEDGAYRVPMGDTDDDDTRHLEPQDRGE